MNAAQQVFEQFKDKFNVHPLALTVLAVCCVLVFWVHRRNLLILLLLQEILFTQSQKIVLVAFDFSFGRFLLLFLLLRVLLWREDRELRFRPLDLLAAAYFVMPFLVYILQRADFSAVIFSCGRIYELLGSYLVIRLSLQDREDVFHLIHWFLWLTVVAGVVFWLEAATGRNVFSIFGGVDWITPMRQGALRCAGPFSSPIIAGVFFAGLIPWFTMVTHRSSYERTLAFLAILLAVWIVYACRSSTPFGSLVVVLGLACLYPLRFRLYTLLAAFVGFLVLLQIVMQAPVYHLIGRIDLVGGSTGWHRFALIDSWLNQWSSWALLGSKNPLGWGNRGLYDVTCEYILISMNGGLLGLVLFLVLLWKLFVQVEATIRAEAVDPVAQKMSWALLVSFGMHLVTFLVLSYFDGAQILFRIQMVMMVAWPQLVLARVASDAVPSTSPVLDAATSPARGPFQPTLPQGPWIPGVGTGQSVPLAARSRHPFQTAPTAQGHEDPDAASRPQDPWQTPPAQSS